MKEEAEADMSWKPYEVIGLQLEEGRSGVITGARMLTPAETMPEESDFSAYFSKCASRIGDTSYAESRGIDRETAERFGLGYDPCFGTGNWKALIIPTGPGSFVARNTDFKAEDRYRKLGGIELLNPRALRESGGRPVFVTEGELDALSVEVAGGHAVALGSAMNIERLLRLAKESPPLVPLIVAPGNDEAGKAVGMKLEAGLKALGVKTVRLNPYGERKDANEALMAGREEFKVAIREAERQAAGLFPDHIDIVIPPADKMSSSFIDRVMEMPDRVPTGFKLLDNALGGGLEAGLYVIGAISSIGKTTFVMQIADQVAEAGNDVIVFSLEMSEDALTAKIVSRRTFLKDKENAKTASEILSKRTYANGSGIIGEALKDYSSKAARNIRVITGMHEVGKVCEAVSLCERSTRRKPVIIIDYLQYLSPGSALLSDKQSMDFIVKSLKALTENKLPVVAISSFNRQSYGRRAMMESFKESGGIEYCCEVLIGLQLFGVGKRGFDEQLAKSRSPRQVELSILKNRSGESGKIICYDYHAKFSCFEERELPFQDVDNSGAVAESVTDADSGGKMGKGKARVNQGRSAVKATKVKIPWC
jgi:replicative DNA helicase